MANMITFYSNICWYVWNPMVWSSLIHFGQIRSDLIQKTWPCLFSWYTWQCFIATFFDKWGIQIWSSLIHFQQIWSDKWTFSNWRKLKELENTNFNHNMWKKRRKMDICGFLGKHYNLWSKDTGWLKNSNFRACASWRTRAKNQAYQST